MLCRNKDDLETDTSSITTTCLVLECIKEMRKERERAALEMPGIQNEGKSS